MINKSLSMVILSCLSFSGAIFPQTKGDAGYIKLYNEGLYSDAITAISKIDSLQRTANDWFYLASACSATKDTRRAVKYFKKSVELDTTHLGYKLNYAKTLNANGDIYLAIEQYRKLIEKDSVNIAANYELGILLMNVKKHSQSKACFERLITLNSNDYASHYNLALAAYNENPSHPDSVIILNHLIRCLILNPRYAAAHDLLGNYYFVRQDYKNALYSYESYTRYKWQDAEAQFKTGLCLEKLKLFTPAISCYEKAVRIDSTVMNYYSHLGYCSYLAGKLDSAAIAYNKAIKLDKENPMLYINLGMVYSNMDSLLLCRDVFKKAEMYCAQSQVAYIFNQLAYCNLKIKNLKEAKLYCEKTLVLEPANNAAQFNLARINDECGLTRVALKNYESALPLLKENGNMQKEYQFALKRVQEIKSK
jgi:tetratricopeptide (TPR) repeat protein